MNLLLAEIIRGKRRGGFSPLLLHIYIISRIEEKSPDYILYQKYPENVESMFYVRVAPWHGLGVCVEEVLNSRGLWKNQASTGWWSSVLSLPMASCPRAIKPISGRRMEVVDYLSDQEHQHRRRD